MLLYKSMLFFIQKFEALLSSQMLNLVDRVLTKTPFGLTVVVLLLLKFLRIRIIHEYFCYQKEK